MRRTPITLLFMALMMSGCASTSHSVEDHTSAEAAPAELAPAEDAAKVDVAPPGEMTRPGEGVCRIYGVPADFDAKGTRISGAFQGELRGEVIGEPGDYRAALALCIDHPKCTGVSSDWYVGAAFRAHIAEGEFVPDADSYACTTLIEGRP